MENSFFSKFNLHHEREDAGIIIDNISKGIVFRGTNLWVLIFAIFIASLGLNVNSTAVIIGAMLISPLMGPIMGLGLGVGINDLSLLRRSFQNYAVATGVALATSTLFFLISPLNEAHSEILARTSPNIYDVLIALFGGLAGIIATASKQKGNVIPGVAIATALMPPLCTAGYGLATLKFEYFFGAFYLFIINTVFIALATFITTRFLHFPYKHLPEEKADRNAKRIIWMIVIVTIVPSIYFGYDIVQQDKFSKKADHFISAAAVFKNDYLLSKKIDARNKTITLVYGGEEIDDSAIVVLRNKLADYSLNNTKLEVHQGFAYLANAEKTPAINTQADQLNLAIHAKDAQIQRLQQRLDSVPHVIQANKQIYNELKAQYADLENAAMGQGTLLKGDTTASPVFIIALRFSRNKSTVQKAKIENWLQVRLQRKNIRVLY